ncbi:MAG: D-arabinono-1,4-lactone oxidase [Mucilaginibacter sp.]
MAPSSIPALGADGFYHPSTESELIALVKKAADETLEIRCRGAAHSLSRAIYTDPGAGCPQLPNEVSEQQPPQGPNLNVMLDQYYQLVWIDEKAGIVEVEAGIHLGLDPNDPTGTSTLENSLLYQAFQRGFCLSDLGGISHQTVSGFMMTGSSGGSVQYSIEENILGLSMIDGTGEIAWFYKGDELFDAIVLSLGLLGVVSKVRLQLIPNFNIYGQQITYTIDPTCPIDLLGDGSGQQMGLEKYLRQTPYSRLLWWPQNKVNRLVIWEASRGTVMPVFDPVPYEEFADTSFMTNVEELGASIMFTMLGNSKFGQVWGKLKVSFSTFNNLTIQNWGDGFFAWIFAGIITFIIQVVAFVLVLFFMTFKGLLLSLYPWILDQLQPLTKKGKGLLFMDYTYRSLPMDNNANDLIMDTEFTEIWIPLEYTSKAMTIVNNLFIKNQYAAMGYYSTEIYASKNSPYWMSPSYGCDVLRIDFFWFKNNEGDPGVKGGYFSQFWDALKQEGVPFRLHWAKFMPEYDYAEWAAYFRSQYPRWDEFMVLREKRDPKNIFLTNYWSRHLLGEDKAN